MVIEIHFDNGTLNIPVLSNAGEALEDILDYDERTRTHRAPAHRYRDIIRELTRTKVPFEDRAKEFEPIELSLARTQDPFPHQSKALDAWVRAGSRGIVELPTGAGKTFVAVLAIARTQRPTLVVVPTIDLMAQWGRVLEEWLGEPVGMLGGGMNERRPITVTTYDSAAFQTEFHGNQFGMLVCDECHHLPAPAYRFIAEGSIAPFRLGLTATLARADGEERVTKHLLGDLVCSIPIDALEGRYLAPYEVRSVRVSLDREEQERYDESRRVYVDFLKKQNISFAHPSGWGKFVMRCHQSSEGRRAFRGYREQRRIALTSKAKIDALWEVLVNHRRDRILVFTEDNETVYGLSRRFLLPTITHQTKPSERKRLLAEFASGVLPVLLTSRVLNEGVDVPDANIGVVLSGSGSVREHVQRLGRILRQRPEKKAVLYEIYTDVAAESGMSERRRQHRAYQK